MTWEFRSGLERNYLPPSGVDSQDWCIFEMLDHCMQPRKGSFEVQDDKGNKYVSLQVKHSLIFSCFEVHFVAIWLSAYPHKIVAA
jgi:hypothetical protein